MNLESSEAPPVPAPRRPDARRIVAGVAGVAALVVAAVFTLGGALVAAIGIAVAAAIARRRGRRLSGASSWIAAVAAVAVVLIGVSGFTAARVPAGTLGQIRHAMDSSQANPPPAPAWLDRIAPGATARANARRSAASGNLEGAFGIWAMVVGTVFLIAMVAGFVGTVGWLATLPLGYAITGRWIGSPAEAT
jgi:MFS family permease